jgi:radical SAM superfamily enzyme YgiQ (UPF0313 family)
MNLKLKQYEQGPIRPPSEASSLLVRLTRNCPWNRCLFCPVYKEEKFSRRSLPEIKEDLEAIFSAVDLIKYISVSLGFSGEVNRQVAALIQSEHPELFQVALWLYRGGETVFLQDGDSLMLPVAQLEEILGLLTEKLPTVNRITSYARSRTILRRSVEDLSRLKKAGLSRIHIGLESGNDKVLEFMKKGVTGAQHIEAGLKVKAAGLSLSEYVMPGLGGTTYWREHAIDTARVLNKIDPHFIRLRTLAVPAGCPLHEKVQTGEFTPLNDDGIARELALFLEHLDGISSYVYSDHVLNLFEDISGRLPDHKNDMLSKVNRYLAMPEGDRNIFRLGRRLGYFRTLGDMNKPDAATPVTRLYEQLQVSGVAVDDYIRDAMTRFI